MSNEPQSQVAAPGPDHDSGKWRQIVGVAFLAQGFAGLTQKALPSLTGKCRLFYLACTYVVAALLPYALFRRRKVRLNWPGVLLGSVSGVTCVLSVYFVLAALQQVRGMIVFSVVPASALAMTLLAGCVIFRERLSRTQTAGGFADEGKSVTLTGCGIDEENLSQGMAVAAEVGFDALVTWSTAPAAPAKRSPFPGLPTGRWLLQRPGGTGGRPRLGEHGDQTVDEPDGHGADAGLAGTSPRR